MSAIRIDYCHLDTPTFVVKFKLNIKLPKTYKGDLFPQKGNENIKQFAKLNFFLYFHRKELKIHDQNLRKQVSFNIYIIFRIN